MLFFEEEQAPIPRNSSLHKANVHDLADYYFTMRK
jgi:hypothetical protein